MMISNIWDILQQNWVATIIGIVALILAFFQFFRKNEPRLCYQFRSLRLIGKKSDPIPDDVSVSFRGSEINHLSRTEIMIWNAGKVAVRGADLVASDPLKMYFNGETKILSVEVEKTTRDSLQFVASISEDRSSVLMGFDFVDHLDGALVQIWHDGYDLTPNSSGTIIGQKKGLIGVGRYIESAQSNHNLSSPATRYEAFLRKIITVKSVSRKIPLYAIIVLGIFIVISGFYREDLNGIYPFIFGEESDKDKLYTNTFFGILYSLTGVWALYMGRRRFPKAITPIDMGEDSNQSGPDDKLPS